MSSTPTIRAQILEALADGPATVSELAQTLPALERASINVAVYAAHRQGLLRVADWTRARGHQGMPAPQWALPDGTPDAKRPRTNAREARADAARRYRARHRARLSLARAAARGQAPTALGAMVLALVGDNRARGPR